MTSWPATPLRALAAGVLVFALAAISGAAQEPLHLGLDEAVELALERNHDVLLAAEQLQQMEGEVQQVKSDIYPQLQLEADYFRLYDESVPILDPGPDNRYAVRASVNQLLFSWGKVSTAIEIAHAGRQQRREELSAVTRRVTLQVHEAFYELLLNQRLVEVAAETLAQRQRQLAVAAKKYDAGVVNEFEVIRARVDVANAEPPVIRSKNRVRQSMSRLNHLLAQDQTVPLHAEGTLTYEPLTELTLDEVVRRAVAQRPELAALQVARDIAEKSVRIARAEDKLQVNLLGEYGFAADTAHDLNPNREVWSAGILFSLPLFDGWRTRGRVASATSLVRETTIGAAQLREAITLEAKIALDDLHEAQQIIDAASLTIQQAEKALELAETSYRYGVATALDVSDAELALTVARTDHARALHDYMRARARVLSVMNEL